MKSRLRQAFFLIAEVGIAAFLYGCGGGGTTTTTTTSIAVPNRTKPFTSAEAAAYLNKLYTGFDEADDKSPIGVTVSMAAQDTSFYNNIYCSLFVTPPYLGKKTGCFKGQADCRLSTAVINHKWMLDKNTGGVASFGQRSVGFVFNQTMVENKWTKCSYIWDGATGNRYNRGCGNGAPGHSCDDGSGSAWFNICPSSKKTCTANDPEVKVAICDVAGGGTAVPPTHDGHAQCVFPGVAMNFHGQNDYPAWKWKDYTRNMARERLKYNGGADGSGPNIEKNNEVVLDEELLIPDYWENPMQAIPAIVYTKSNINIARNNAKAIRDDYCKYAHCEDNGGGLIPLVMIDDTAKHPSGPFFADRGEEESTMEV